MLIRFVFVLSFVCLAAGSVASAQVQTYTATHTYILGDQDSKTDARERCLLEAKRKILEQAGVYIESASEMRDLQLTKDKIASFAAAVMQVKDTKEEVGFQQGRMTLTLTMTAQVDLSEVHQQVAARQVDANMRNDVTAQKERLKRLEMQLEAMQQRIGKGPGQTPAPPPSGISAAEVHTLTAQATQGNAEAQIRLGWMYASGEGVPQDYPTARRWWEKAAAQGDAVAQVSLGELYIGGLGGAQDNAKARQWYEKAAAQGNALAQSNLGRMHFFGQGGPVDIATAREWYSKSAAQGNAVGQVDLGALYDFGLGVRQSDVRAYMWYSLAAEQSTDASDTYAADRRDNVAGRMTSAQIAEARRLVQQCQTHQLKGC